MIKKYLIFVITLLLSINTNSLVGKNSFDKDNYNKRNVNDNQEIITMKDIASFLETKEEHYPFSDEFIERYQQKSGGYIYNAVKANLVVDKRLHEPNQKWHFFDSWLYPSIEDKSLSWDESAESRVYTKLLCPELLLWIYEATEVDINKVRNAKEVAELGKETGVATTTIAKNMRQIVSWDDCKTAILRFKQDNAKPYSVSVNCDSSVEIVGLEEEYYVGSKVSFGVKLNDNSRVIDEVKMNNTILNMEDDKYSFTMPSENVVITVTMKDKVTAERVNLSRNSLELKVGDKNVLLSSSVVPADTTDIPVWEIIEGEKNVSLSLNGDKVFITAKREGFAKIKISYNENVYDECNVIISKNENFVESSIYNIKYDLGSSKIAVSLKNSEEVKSVFSLNENSEDDIILSIDDFENVYGGGSGGTGENKWLRGDMLKFGTTSVNGNLTMSLSSFVNRVKITGYTTNKKGELQIGDSKSLDWTSSNGDGKTTTIVCNEMTETTLENITSNSESTIVVDIEETNSLKISTINKKPIYITGIEFMYVER